jgi:hypothetical protein
MTDIDMLLRQRVSTVIVNQLMVEKLPKRVKETLTFSDLNSAMNRSALFPIGTSFLTSITSLLFTKKTSPRETGKPPLHDGAPTSKDLTAGTFPWLKRGAF